MEKKVKLDEEYIQVNLKTSKRLIRLLHSTRVWRLFCVALFKFFVSVETVSDCGLTDTNAV